MGSNSILEKHERANELFRHRDYEIKKQLYMCGSLQ